MTVVEYRLPMDFAGMAFRIVFDPSLFPQFLVQRRAGHGRIQHELVKICIVLDSIVNHAIDVLGSVGLQADNGGSEHANSMRLKPGHDAQRVRVSQFQVPAVLALQAHPDPGHAQSQELLFGITASTFAELNT